MKMSQKSVPFLYLRLTNIRTSHLIVAVLWPMQASTLAALRSFPKELSRAMAEEQSCSAAHGTAAMSAIHTNQLTSQA